MTSRSDEQAERGALKIEILAREERRRHEIVMLERESKYDSSFLKVNLGNINTIDRYRIEERQLSRSRRREEIEKGREEDRQRWKALGGGNGNIPTSTEAAIEAACGIASGTALVPGKNAIVGGMALEPKEKPCPAVEAIDWHARANLFEQLVRESLRYLPKHLRLTALTALDRRP